MDVVEEEDETDVAEDAGDSADVSRVSNPQSELGRSFSLVFCRLSTVALATAF